MKLTAIISLIIWLFVALSLPVQAGDSPLIIEALGPKCQHGLHQQPRNGAFSVFLFCDDALGANIGIILTERGAGPGPTPLPETKQWANWNTTNRFWQDRKWAADVVNFAWSPSQRFLYVATSGTYGDGGFFKLDLRERTYERLAPRPDAPYKAQLSDMNFTRIKQIDNAKKEIIVEISLADPKEEKVAIERIPFE